MLGGRGVWTALAVGVAMLVVVPAPTAQAATCPFAGTVRTWTGATDSNWHNGANWTPAGIPDATTLVCIPDASAVDMGGVQQVVVPAFWVGDATLELHDGAGLFAMSHTTESAVEAGGSVDVTSGFLGGEGVLRVRGDVSVASSASDPSALASTPSAPTTQPGTLVVEASGQLSFPTLGVNVRRGYRIQVNGTVVMTGSGFISADWGTAFLIGATGVLDIGNDNGYFQGIAQSGPAPSDLVNGGLVRKSAGNGVSAIDAAYQEVGSGAVEVRSGTLVLPDGNIHPAQVGASSTLATGRCGQREQLDPCVVTTLPARDPQSVSFRVPGSDADGARVQVREESPRVFFAHADGLATPASDPAVITMRMGQGIAGTTNPAALDVVHVDDRGVETVLKACPAVGLPSGVTNCVDNAASVWDGANVYKVVRTTQTSRYICRKDDGVGPVFLKKAAPAKKKVGLGRPIVVTATINEAGKITAKGTIKTKGVRVTGLKLKGSVSPAPGVQGKVVLKLTKAQKKKLAKAGAQKGTITIKVVAVDAGGNKTKSKPFKVKLT